MALNKYKNMDQLKFSLKEIRVIHWISVVGEGFRSIDLLRNGLIIPGKENIQPVPPSSVNYSWPISSNELLFNKLMTPND